MSEHFPAYRVEVLLSGPAPVRQVARAAGVSDVVGDGTLLRCRVHGSFQPLLEALLGYEVLLLASAGVLEETSISGLEDCNHGTV